ncbi:MAG TPA: phytoene/squalene synthase family protein [Candidatus Omnitrophota bacterium]|nr:phytoene/squalene synthase family protein [Candidatus Omnitrophota bacterium]
MASKLHRLIFKTGSRTYFTSSLFFPRAAREEVSVLYAFVRRADDFVDTIPQDKASFDQFAGMYRSALASGKASGDPVIDPFIGLLARRSFDPAWVEAFLGSMEMDTYKNEYHDIGETEKYIYGSAEVIGLMMARILGLPTEALPCARLQGKAMQYINFIRDLNEDLKLGRVYLPKDEIRRFGLASLDQDETSRLPTEFKKFIDYQLARYEDWQDKAAEGFKYLPKRYLVPVKTAAEMYAWTAREIKKDPFIIYRKAVKPTWGRIIGRAIFEYLFNH